MSEPIRRSVFADTPTPANPPPHPGVASAASASRMQEVFSRIYRDNEWQGSGPGSTAETSFEYRYFLEAFVRANRVRSVLDIGCGDWRFSRYVPWEGVHYLGMEVVPQVVEANRKCHESDHVRFVCADARFVELPPTDLLIMKDVLQHWSNAEVAEFLPRVRKYPLALITNTTNRVQVNQDCTTGGYRYLDLTRAPFNLPATVLLRYTANVPGRHPDEKSVLLLRGG
jgi:SAM-dependent methyltransferase